MISRDQELQRFLPDQFKKLRPLFAKNGTITTANSSKINDGACALVLMSEDAARQRGLKPLARVVDFEDAGVMPIDFGIAPTLAVNRILERQNLTIDHIDFHEINEVFAGSTLANMKLMELDPDRVNIHGGAISLGHPLGMTGTRIILSLINVLRLKSGRLGLASIANGGGGASAVLLERLN